MASIIVIIMIIVEAFVKTTCLYKSSRVDYAKEQCVARNIVPIYRGTHKLYSLKEKCEILLSAYNF